MRPYKCQQRFQIPNARIGTDTLNNVRGSSGPQANTVLHGPVPQDAAEKACHKRVSRTGSLHYRNIVAAAVKGHLRRFAEAVTNDRERRKVSPGGIQTAGAEFSFTYGSAALGKL